MKERIGNKQLGKGIEKEWLLESILNDSEQMIYVGKFETYTMLYANHAVRIYTGYENQPYQGERCYKYMMGLDALCPFCAGQEMQQNENQENEVNNEKKIYAVKTKVINWNGKKVFIEYVWHKTESCRSLKSFETKEQFDIVNALSRDYLNIFLVDGEYGCCKNIKTGWLCDNWTCK